MAQQACIIHVLGAQQHRHLIKSRHVTFNRRRSIGLPLPHVIISMRFPDLPSGTLCASYLPEGECGALPDVVSWFRTSQIRGTALRD